MEPDLRMAGHDYNNALTIFFISYALAEPITNVLLKRLTPRVFFTAIILLWGLIMTLMGLVKNYAGLLACRCGGLLASASSLDQARRTGCSLAGPTRHSLAGQLRGAPARPG